MIIADGNVPGIGIQGDNSLACPRILECAHSWKERNIDLLLKDVL